MEFLANKNLQKLATTFKSAGFEIRVVGGAVRDALQGIEPHDIDLCTDATPDEMVTMAEANQIRTIPTGIEHGTLTFIVGGETFEVTTLRVDVETDGRHAVVEFTRSFEKDAERRDLTFNAMSMDMEGTLYDYFEGKFDLDHQIVRFVGDMETRVREDYLRIFRWFRFYARYGSGNVEYGFIERLQKARWMHKGVKELSAERIWSELKKIIEGKNGVKTMRGLIDSGLMQSFLEQKYFGQLSSSFDHHRKAVDRFMFQNKGSYNRLPEFSALGQIAAMIGHEHVEEFCDAMKVSSWERSVLVASARHSYREIYEGLRTGEALKAQAWFYNEVAKGVDPNMAAMIVIVDMAYAGVMPSWLFQAFKPDGTIDFINGVLPFEITGKDLIAMGIKPGPQMGHILRCAREYWHEMDCRIGTREIMAMVLGVFDDVSSIHTVIKPLVREARYFKEAEADDDQTYEAEDLDMDYWSAKSTDFCNEVARLENKKFFYVVTDMEVYKDQELVMLFKSKDTAMVYKLRDDFLNGSKG